MSVNEGGGERFELTDGRSMIGVGIGEKGTYPARVTALGEAGHGSMPTLGDNAVPHLGELITRVGRGLPDPVAHPLVDRMLERPAGRCVRPRRRPARGPRRGRRAPPRARARDARARRHHDGADHGRRLRQAQHPCPAGPGWSSTAGSCPTPPRPMSRRRSATVSATVPPTSCPGPSRYPRQRLASRRAGRAGDPRLGEDRGRRRRAAADPGHRVHRLRPTSGRRRARRRTASRPFLTTPLDVLRRRVPQRRRAGARRRPARLGPVPPPPCQGAAA